MENNNILSNREALKAYTHYERQIYVRHLEVGSYLVMALMPAGVVLDYYVYPAHLAYFLKLRTVAAFMGGLVWLALQTRLRGKVDRFLSLVLALIPAYFICWMIHVTEGVNSPYYAGLNLVLLSVALVMRWSADLSIAASALVVLMYFAACFFRPPVPNHDPGIFFNNLYFLVLTAIIVVISGWVHRSLRIREFVLNYELDQSKRELETTNTKLSEQNLALEKANREIKEAEIQLVQAEKMSSLGRFSAGLMHDILNPLNYARTGTFTLRKKSRHLSPELRSEFDETLTDIEDGLKRVDHIVSDLRSFTHPGGQTPESVELADIFKTSLRFVSSELKEKNISLELNLLPDQKIWIGRNQSILVLVNLLENAIDALAEKTFPAGEQPVIQISSHTQGDHGLIFIRDNGPGIGADILPRIFDPFFTTKDVGKGTGLGLSICFGIIRGYGGNLTVNSEPGKFCEFTLDLPANEAAAQSPLKNAD